MMKTLIISAVSLAFFAGTAQSQEVDAQATAQCLIENSTEAAEDMMRDFFIAALSENAEAATASSLAVGNEIIQIAIGKCGISLTQLDAPEFVAAVEAYGEYLGEKVMSDAMANIGM